jgi:penicillin amidase
MKINRFVLLSLSLIFPLIACDDEKEKNPHSSMDQSTMSADMQQNNDQNLKDAQVQDQVLADQMLTDQSLAGVHINGLSAEVKISTDEWGIPHIQCTQANDCFMAQGYLHAQNRFVQMDINRKFPQGKIGEMVGPLTRSVDLNSRLLLSTQNGGSIEDQMWQNADAETQAALTAYTKGVNAWIEDYQNQRNGAKLSEEYDFPLLNIGQIEAWTEKDSLSVSLILIQQLTDDHAEELTNGQRLAQYGPELYAQLYSLLPSYDSSVLDPTSNKNQANATHTSAFKTALLQTFNKLKDTKNLLLEAQKTVNPKLFGKDFGSNNWIVSPAKSETEKALLSNDPHLGLSNPSIWYITHLSASDLNVGGVSLPGLPGVIIGQNDHIAWGMTTTYFDFSDVYVETLSDDGEGVIFNGAVVPFTKVNRSFKFYGQPEEIVEQLYVPHHGPVLSIDRTNKKAITMRWTAQNASTDVNFIIRLAKATSVQEAKEALKQITTIGQNIVVADQDGHIGWFPYNRLPSRPWASIDQLSIFPLSGEGALEWGDWIPYEDLPQAIDPAKGYLSTANNDMTGAFSDGDPTNNQTALQGSPASGHRHGRIVERLEALEKHSVDTFKSIIADQYSLVGAQIIPVILSSVDQTKLSAGGNLVYQALSQWAFDCPSGMQGDFLNEATPNPNADIAKESAGCAAMHVLYSELLAMFYDEINQAGGNQLGGPYLDAPIQAIVFPDRLSVSFWDDVTTPEVETQAMMLAQMLNNTHLKLKNLLGETPDTWLWGKIHTLTLSANLFSAAGFNNFDHGPFVNGGGLFTVDVANPESFRNGEYQSSSGASTRWICELTAPPSCSIQLPGGQSHHRDAMHYNDLMPKWLARQSIDLIWTAERLAALPAETFKP